MASGKPHADITYATQSGNGGTHEDEISGQPTNNGDQTPPSYGAHQSQPDEVATDGTTYSADAVPPAPWSHRQSTRLSVIQSNGSPTDTTMHSLMREESTTSNRRRDITSVDLSTESSHEVATRKPGTQRRSHGWSSQGSITSGDLTSATQPHNTRRRRRIQQSNAILRVVFGIGPQTLGQPGSKLIHPNSWFTWGMTAIATIFLAFVAIVTPVIIGFFWDAEPCMQAPTLRIDIAVECFFIFEIFTKFYTGIYHQGVYVDDWAFVVIRYLKGDFLFDIITSVPAGIVEYVSIQHCNVESADSNSSRELRMVRFLKGFRLIKMLRVLKTSSLVHAVQYMESIVKPPMVISRIAKLIMSILLIVHFATCFYWLIKVEFRYSGSTGADALEMLKEANQMPEDPTLGDKYIISMYFINTVFSTVGFGDIAAENNAERIYTVIVMYVGTLVFGAMLGEVQNIMDSLRKADRERTLAVQETKDYLRAHQAPPEVERQMLSWVYFNEDVRIKDEQRFAVWSRFPDTLMYSLASHLHKDMLLKVGEFRSISQHKQSEGFLLDLYQSMESVTFCENHAIGQAGHPADCLYYVVSGAVRVTVPDTSQHGRSKETILTTLNPGDIFGEYSLFEDTTWQTSMGTSATFTTMSHVHVKALSRERFLDVLSLYDADLEEDLMDTAASNRVFRKRVGASKQTIPVMRWCQLLWKVVVEVRTQMEHEGGAAFFRLGKKMQFKTMHGRVLNKRKSSMKRKPRMLDGREGSSDSGIETVESERPLVESELTLAREANSRNFQSSFHREHSEFGAGALAYTTALERRSSSRSQTPSPRRMELLRKAASWSSLGKSASFGSSGLVPNGGGAAPFRGALISHVHSEESQSAHNQKRRSLADIPPEVAESTAFRDSSEISSGSESGGVRFQPKRTVPLEKSGPKSYMRGMIAGSFKGDGTASSRPMHASSSFSSGRAGLGSSFRLRVNEMDEALCPCCGQHSHPPAPGKLDPEAMGQIQEAISAAEQRLEQKLESMLSKMGGVLLERITQTSTDSSATVI